MTTAIQAEEENNSDRLIESEEQEDTGITDEEANLLAIDRHYYNILDKSGKDGCGRFQWHMIIILLLGMNGFSFFNLGIGYFELMPTFNCINTDGIY